MKTTLQTRIGRATVDDGVWSSDVPTLLRLVQNIERSPAWTVPDPDYALAMEAIRLLDGEIVEYDGPPQIEPGEVY